VDGLRVVQSGLAPGENIVINGLLRVRPGMKVAPKAATMLAVR
jgi:multidrug efflux system membrane fusion protein